MPDRKPQINFQVDQSLKTLYEEAKAAGFSVTRLCAAGLLLLVHDADVRARGINLLREWEAEYSDASEDEIRTFVEEATLAVQRSARGSLPARKSRAAKKVVKRPGS